MGAAEQLHEPRLRIGELAELAGTTTRAVRHYHSLGLLGDAARDGSGYRRYGAEHLVRLVRIRRLRALGMPLAQIAAHLSGEPEEHADLRTSLRSLAEDVDRQIEELRTLRQKLLDVASSTSFASPVETWQAGLRARGLLGTGSTLAPGEQEAVEILDVLHPGGVEGLIAQSSALLSDPVLVRRLEPLLERFGSLRDDESAIEELALEVSAVLPRPGQAVPSVDLETMDRLLGDRFTPAQRRFLHRLRQLLAPRGS